MKTEIKLNGTYTLGTYKSHGIEIKTVRVTRIEADERGWYDDHQEGGWDSRGVVYFRYDDPEMNEINGEGSESLEYARDNWTIAEPAAAEKLTPAQRAAREMATRTRKFADSMNVVSTGPDTVAGKLNSAERIAAAVLAGSEMATLMDHNRELSVPEALFRTMIDHDLNAVSDITYILAGFDATI